MAIAYTEISRNKFKTALLLILFIGFVMGAGFIVAEYNQPGAGMVGLTIAAAVAIIWSAIAYFTGDKITLSASGAKEIKRRDHPTLYRTVENLAITAGLPTPKVYIIDSPALNAFATGRNPEHGVVAVTTGLLNKLDKKELEGVLAHELSHIGNFDTRLLLLVTTLVGVIMILSDLMWRMQFFGNRRNNNNKGNTVIMILGLLFILLGPLVATLIKLAISRKRESLADASATLLTRYPEGLASALEKIAHDPTELKTATKGTAHLYIANPLKSQTWRNLFSTHPPIEQRISTLRNMNHL